MNVTKKRIYRVSAVIVLCVAMVVCALQFRQTEEINDNEEIPLGFPNSVLVTQGAEDKQVIPDKYNTGCTESRLTGVVDRAGTYNGALVSEYGNNQLALRMKKYTAGTLTYENMDFSNQKFVIADEAENGCTVRFQNCKFSSLRIANIGESKTEYIFENCSFAHFAGSNSTFEGCYFGSGSMGDGINPYRNCTFRDCMIADLIQPAASNEVNHVDGVQMFGDSSAAKLDNINIHFENCRFEVPNIPYSAASGILNCPVTLTMRYSNASDIGFKDCIVNGGTYYSIMVQSSSFEISNIKFENVRVGGSRKSANVIGDVAEIYSGGIQDMDRLYVGSVWKSDRKIHLSVTNDTNQERTLKIITSRGDYEEVIPACPVSYNIPANSIDYEDLPFDRDITVEEADWVVCYDVTGGEAVQIRFVSWLGQSVYVDQEKIMPSMAADESAREDSAVLEEISKEPQSGAGLEASVPLADMSGMCGDKVSYTLAEGILTLSGEGETWQYNSSKTAPWYGNREEISEIRIGEGISVLGSQLFASCTKVKEVVIPDGVEEIRGNAFIKCGSLEKVSLPRSLGVIGRYAFAGTKITEVMYAGSQEQWKEITIGTNNEMLVGAALSYIQDIPAAGTEETDAGACGKDVRWVLYSDGVLYINGTGGTDNYNSRQAAPWAEYRSSIVKVIVEEGVTSLGGQVFVSCTALEEVECPDSLVTIGSNAFIKCSSLKKISLGSGLEKIDRYAFAGTKLETVEYRGTKETWQEIQIGEKNEPLVNAVGNTDLQ